MKNGATDFFTTVELDRVKVFVDQKLSRFELYGLRDVEVFRALDHMTDTVAFHFRAFVLGENQEPIKLGPVPRSWWQMFKRDVMPGWFVRWFPVLTNEVEIDATVLYPDLKISVPQGQSRVVVRFHKKPFPNFRTQTHKLTDSQTHNEHNRT